MNMNSEEGTMNLNGAFDAMTVDDGIIPGNHGPADSVVDTAGETPAFISLTISI
jgi:hypothetical protein